MERRHLAGLRVIEDGEFASAAYCSKLLGDLGAEVIKIEKPGGDEARRHGPFPGDIPDAEKSGRFLWLNTNKKGITLDSETAAGREILNRLLADADVFVENYIPKKMERLGMRFEDVASRNPRLVMASITPFGQTGPYRNYRAYAINAAAAGGISYVVGTPGREPLTPPLEVGHVQSGVAAAVAVCYALMARQSDGLGQHVDISEAEVWAGVHTGHLLNAFIYYQRKRMRSGHRVSGAAYPYTILPCKDGHLCMIAIQGQEWARFLRIVGDGDLPEWCKLHPEFSDRVKAGREHADEIDALLAPWLLSHSKEEIFKLCLEAKVPFAPVKTMGEVVNEEHLRARDFFEEVDHPRAGKTKHPGPPFKFSDLPRVPKSPAPLLGQHNEEIYCRRLGYSRAELVALRRSKVI